MLEGSYQHAGKRIRVTVQLVSARDGAQLWSGTLNDEFRNIFAVQDSVSTEAPEVLMTNLGEAERRLLAKRPTSSVEAYQEYLKGRHFWNKRTGEGMNKAIEYFNRAIDVDPLFARAHAGLADLYALLSYYGGTAPSECFPKSKAAAARALELDETLAEAHASLAYARLNYDWEIDGAEKEFKRSLELGPDYAPSTDWQFYLKKALAS
jgi:tetratricopeptide (TPR) repeat protein